MQIQTSFESLRKDFPILGRTVRENKPLIYLDNASTTQKPNQVIDAISDYYRNYNANIHRAVYALAEEATEEYEKARDKVANFVGVNNREEIIFVRGTTEAINLVAYAWGRTHIKEGDIIVTTEYEHHSNIVPWQLLTREKNAKVEYIRIDDNGELILDDLDKILATGKVKLVTFSLMSNVLGTISDAKAIISKCRQAEVRNLDEIMTVAKAPHVIVLGGSKVLDRLEAIKLLIQNRRADHILLTGLIGNVFMRAQARIKSPLGIKREEEVVAKAHTLIGEYPDVFSTPVDIAIDKDGERVEMDVRDLAKGDNIYDLGPKTVNYYSKLIAGAGTVFISGPAGFFEKENFSSGTKGLLSAVANSMATTIVSGGHLTSALKKYGLAEQINHISTAGGALVLYLTGEKLPMMKSLEDAADRKLNPSTT